MKKSKAVAFITSHTHNKKLTALAFEHMLHVMTAVNEAVNSVKPKGKTSPV